MNEVVENDWGLRLANGEMAKCPECGHQTLDDSGMCWWRDCHYHSRESWAGLDAETDALGLPRLYPEAPSRAVA